VGIKVVAGGGIFGLWNGDLPSNVIIRKAPRCIHEDERRLGRRSSSRFSPLAPTMPCQDLWMGRCTRRAVLCGVFVWGSLGNRSMRIHLLGTVLLAQEGMYILRGECVFLIYRLAYRASFVGSSRFLFVIRAGSCQWFLVFPSLWFVFKF